MVVVALALALAACGSHGQWIPPGLGLNQLMAVPQPFKQRKAIPAASIGDADGDVAITGIAGGTPNDVQRLAAAISRAAEPSDILVETHLTERRTSLLEASATLTAMPSGRHILLTLNWRHPDGTLGKTFAVSAEDPRYAGDLDPETIAALGRAAALSLASAMGATPVEPPRPNPAAAQASVYIEPVKGAPGDGNRALTTAMAVELASDGINLTTDKKHARFLLAGAVALTDNEDGSQKATISWRILSPTGVELAKVEQANAVERGSLNRTWGDTAYDVANAAGDGLIDAFTRILAAPPESSTGSPVPSPRPR